MKMPNFEIKYSASEKGLFWKKVPQAQPVLVKRL